MATAKEWVVANKVKTGFSLIAAVVAVVILPVSFVAWSADQTAEQIRDAALVEQGREEAIHSAQNRAIADTQAKHDYDFFDIRVAQAEEELIQLEEDADSGVQLTATQERKMRRLEQQVVDFQGRQDEALEQLSEEPEHEHVEEAESTN